MGLSGLAEAPALAWVFYWGDIHLSVLEKFCKARNLEGIFFESRKLEKKIQK